VSEEHFEKRNRDVRLRVDADSSAEIWRHLSVDVPPAPWVRDDDFARRWDRDGLVFKKSNPPIHVFVLRKSGSIDVCNIVFDHGYNVDEYNRQAGLFAKEVLGPALKVAAVADEIEFGPEETRIEDLAPAAVVELLRRFSRWANKSTGNAHPYDNDRWLAFVREAARLGVALDSEFLEQWLVSSGWSRRWAKRLAHSYHDQRDALSGAEVIKVAPDADIQWVEATSRITASHAVAFIDTSSLLNLIELPERATPETATRVTGSALWLVSRAESVRDVTFVLVDVVVRELERQRPKVVDRVSAELQKSHDRLLASDAAFRALGRDDEDPPRRPNLAAQVNLLSDLVVRFQRVAEVLPVTDRIRSLAHERSLDGRAPAHLGKKDSVADCTIVEAVFALAALTRTTTFWLLSANERDFEREELRSELEGAGVEFVDRWVKLEELVRRRLNVPRS
jgi:hypothetical protein